MLIESITLNPTGEKDRNSLWHGFHLKATEMIGDVTEVSSILTCSLFHPVAVSQLDSSHS